MSNLFNPDNAFFTFMGKLCDMIVMSIVYIVLCIPVFIIGLFTNIFDSMGAYVAFLPIVTIGPASSALYYAMVKVIRRDRGYVSKEFFKSFKENFKVGAIASVIYAVIAYILYIDYQYASYLKEQGDNMGVVFTIAFNAILIIILFIFVWTFPVLSRFQIGVKQLYKNALLISIRHFPTTILLIALFVGFVIGSYLILPVLLISPALYAFISSFLIERVLKKYTPKQEGTPEETGVDEWYNE